MTRETIPRRAFIKSGVIASTGLLVGKVNSMPQDKPNVIIILTDDQGTLDLGCYGSKDLITPHIDRLAEEGILFS